MVWGCSFGVQCSVSASLGFSIQSLVTQRKPLGLSKLDYSRISHRLWWAFVPWLYYSVYCSPQPHSSTCPSFVSWAFLPSISLAFLSTCRKEWECSWDWLEWCCTHMYLLSPRLCCGHHSGPDGPVVPPPAVTYITRAGKCDMQFQSHRVFHTLVAFLYLSSLQGCHYGLDGGCLTPFSKPSHWRGGGGLPTCF